MRSFLKYFLLAGAVLLAVSLWRSSALPQRSELVGSLQDEPEQTPVAMTPFDVVSGGITYTVKPLYRYDLHGLIVSKHNADTWWDYMHREANDALNITDLCVVWGANIMSDVYRQISFSNGQFTCNYSTGSNEVWAAFDQAAVSNNHLLADNPALARLMRKVEVGDQVRFRGYLAEYSHHHGFEFHRGTSTVRTDSGNGACETVYVEDFEILRPGGGPWRILRWVAVAMLVLGVIGWFVQPARFDD